MDEIKRNLDFHQTFKPERNCLNALLTDLPGCTGKTVQEISVMTGIPTGVSSGKVVPSIYYLSYMGLLSYALANKTYEFSYTDLGERVLNEDPGLMEDLSLLLMHCMLVRSKKGAELWNYIFMSVLPKYHGVISKSNLEQELQMYFQKNVSLAPFNGSYTGLFEQIGILNITTDSYEVMTHRYNSEFIYLYALVMYEYWDIWMNSYSIDEQNEKKISATEITSPQLEEIGFRYPFGWDTDDEYSVLEALHDKGIILLNRQMVPFSIRRVYSREEIIELLFSELC